MFKNPWDPSASGGSAYDFLWMYTTNVIRQEGDNSTPNRALHITLGWRAL